jgi:hypothetical protein
VAGARAQVYYFPSGATSLAEHPAWFGGLAAAGLVTSFSSTLMFTALGSFFNRISDPDMGGAYLTLLNTIANMGARRLPSPVTWSNLPAAATIPDVWHADRSVFGDTFDASWARCSHPVTKGMHQSQGSGVLMLCVHARAGVILPKLVLFTLMDVLTERRCEGGKEPGLACARVRVGGREAGACAAAGGTCVVLRDGFYVLSGLMICVGAAAFLWLRRLLPRLEALPIEAWRAKHRGRQL